MSSLLNLNPYERHKLILEEYILKKPNIEKRDIDIIRENHKFIWDDNLPENELTWREQLARKYYNKLFKEYCICDLSKYKENKVALRWRTEKEVIAGKGQFMCGHKSCNIREELRSWEVNFGYLECGEKKNALVKLRLCSKCSNKLNYRSQKREIKRAKKMIHKNKKSNVKIHIETTSNSDDSNFKRSPNKNEIEVTNECDDKEVIEQSVNDEEEEGNNWKNIPIDDTEPSRESEFEKYLEDLLF